MKFTEEQITAKIKESAGQLTRKDAEEILRNQAVHDAELEAKAKATEPKLTKAQIAKAEADAKAENARIRDEAIETARVKAQEAKAKKAADAEAKAKETTDADAKAKADEAETTKTEEPKDAKKAEGTQ